MIKIYEKQYRNYGIDYGMVTLVKRGEKMVKLTDEEEQIKEVIIAARTLEEYLWGEYNGEWNIEEWRRMFRKRIQKIDDIDVNNPHAIIEMRKRLMQNAALSVALMKILDTDGIPLKECDIPSNLPQYANEEKEME